MAFDPNQPRDERGRWTDQFGVVRATRMFPDDFASVRPFETPGQRAAKRRRTKAAVQRERQATLLGDAPQNWKPLSPRQMREFGRTLPRRMAIRNARIAAENQAGGRRRIRSITRGEERESFQDEKRRAALQQHRARLKQSRFTRRTVF